MPNDIIYHFYTCDEIDVSTEEGYSSQETDSEDKSDIQTCILDDISQIMAKKKLEYQAIYINAILKIVNSTRDNNITMHNLAEIAIRRIGNEEQKDNSQAYR